jgi:hypothetical protein
MTTYGKISHANLLSAVTLFDQRHSLKLAMVIGELFCDSLEEGPVEIVNDVQVPRQELLEKGHGPFLQGFREHGVIGKGERAGHNFPCFAPWNFLLCSRSNRFITIEVGYGFGVEVGRCL